MNHVTYQVRTIRGTPVYSFDSFLRAQEEKLNAEKRVGCKMKLVRITRIEEEVE